MNPAHLLMERAHTAYPGLVGRHEMKHSCSCSIEPLVRALVGAGGPTSRQIGFTTVRPYHTLMAWIAVTGVGGEANHSTQSDRTVPTMQERDDLARLYVDMFEAMDDATHFYTEEMLATLALSLLEGSNRIGEATALVERLKRQHVGLQAASGQTADLAREDVQRQEYFAQTRTHAAYEDSLFTYLARLITW